MIDEAAINRNIAKLKTRIRQIAQESGRDPETITLLAVSKTRPASAICAAADAGLTQVGENYIQEALDKQAELSDRELIWHCIGPVQSNKTRQVAENFDWLHTLDRLKIARRLNDQRPDHLPPLNLCLQVNLDQETQKAGVAAEALPDLAAEIAALPRLRLRGLMAIPAPRDTIDDQRAVFRELRHHFEALQVQQPNLDTLSMGMSRDYAAAIAEGSTIIRIGTDIFGARD